jgi:response regulator RpfG family c-di-GMP phosphodiesterase
MILAAMSKKLSSLLGNSPEVTNEIYDFTKIYIDNNVSFNTDNYQNEDEKFEVIRTQTELGSKLISRMELTRKCEDIIRATFEGSNDDAFINRMKKIQNNIESQIILICDLYVSMRSVKSYKKAYNHKITMNYIEEHFKYYFDPLVFERFIRFSSDFEELYNEM